MNSHLRIAITLPYNFTIRDFLFTPVWEEMVKRKDVHFFLLCNNVEVGKLISERNCLNITFLEFPPPSDKHKSYLGKIFRRGLFGWFDETYLFDSLGYRFAALNNLSHYRIRKGKSRKERRRQQIFLDYRKGEIVGHPFPKSKIMFRFLYEFRHSFLNYASRRDMIFLQNLKLDLFVFGRLHFKMTVYWAKILRCLGVPMIGIVSSWDHPTTKGPTPCGMSGYIVASSRMVEEMSVLHGIQKEKICQIGKVQMDLYTDPSIFNSREDFLKKLGVSPDHRLVTFGTNTTGLKEHEVSIARKLSRDFAEGCYGKTTLLLRTHPQDTNWERDFLSLTKPPWVLCLRACSFGNQALDSMSNGCDDQIMLANLMKYSDIVIQSRGSLVLDAIAFDTPVISVAFDGDLERKPEDSFLHEYEFEHYKPLITAEGTWMVGSYRELARAIREYLRAPTIHSEGRRIVREEHLEPLDGKVSQRLVNYLVESARNTREGTFPDGDWNYTGLGDVMWSSRQICNAQDYVQK